jgi:hypothetical protein
MASNTDDFIVKNGLVVRATNLANYQSTSTTTGAIITPGGIGVGGDAYIGGNLNVLTSATLAELQVNDVVKVLSTAVNTSTILAVGNALQVSGGIFATNINLSGIGVIKGSRILTEAEGFTGGTITNPLFINTTTQSTSTTTGALTTPGGVGIGKNLNVGGNAVITGTLTVVGDAFGGGSHLLTTLQTTDGPGISSGVTYSGYQATIALTNTGVLSAIGGTGISVSTATGNVTINNTGVTAITSGTDINISQATGNVTISVTSTLQSVSSRGATTNNAVSITNSTTGNSTSTGNALNVTGSIGTKQINIANTSYINGAQIITTSTIGQFVGGTIQNTLRINNTTSSISTDTGALIVDGGVGVGENVNIGKNLTVRGDTTLYGNLNVIGSYTTVTVNSTQTYIRDAAIDIGTNIDNAPLTINDGLDRGLLLHYNTGSSSVYDNHAFVGRQSNSGEFIYLTNVTPGGNENVPNPFTGDWGTARFGSLRLVNGTISTNTSSGDLVITGGAGIGGSLYATSLYDAGNRVVTSVVPTGGLGIGISNLVSLGTTASFQIDNTGIINLTQGSGINLTGTNSNITVTNVGVLKLDVSTNPGNNDIAVSTSTGTILISNTSTLQTVTARGNSSTYQILFNNTTTSTTVADNNAVVVAGGISAKTLLVQDSAFINGAQVITSATINAFGGGIINNYLKLNVNTHSTSTTSGALIVVGGVGIGDNINVQNTVTILTTASTALSVGGGASFGGSGTFTGAGSFGGSLNVGSSATILDNLYASRTIYSNTLTSTGTNLNLNSNGGSIYANGFDLLAYDNHVIYVSDGTGNDTTGNGRSIISAYATIAKALSVATAGDIVFVEAGQYTEVFPLTIPAGVTVKGSSLRAVIVRPTVGTKYNDAFLLNGENCLTDFTIADFFSPGYAFKFATGAKITTKSPYIERVSVITKGSVTTSSDPYGFASNDAGGGAYLDASVLDSTSLEPAMLWNEVTFIVPNATGMYMTNGARAELLNGFFYFADKAIDAQAGLTGYGGVGKTKIKLSGVSGTFSSGQTLTYRNGAGTTLASGTISSVSGSYIYLTGPAYGFETASDRIGKTVNTYGNTKQTSAIKKFITAGQFDGNGDYLEVLNDTDFQFGTGNYTVEAWVYLNSLGKTHRVFYKGTVNASNLSLRVNSSNVLQGKHGTTTITGTTSLTTGQWYHVALSHSSAGALKIFLNGSQEATTTGITDNINNTDPVSIGGEAAVTADSLDGYMDDFRISKSYRYPSAFTAPTSELTSDSDTVLLLNMDGGNNVTIFTDNGNTTQAISNGLGATATKIELADYHQFGGELRCIGSAAVFGNSGVTANGTGTDLKLIAFNMSHIGSGGDLSDDISLVDQGSEVIQTNGGKVYYQTVDQSGDFRVGDSFIVNQRTGSVSFGNAQVNLTSLQSLTISDGTNNATILPTDITVGNLGLSGNTLRSSTGNLTLDPYGSLTTINSDLQVNGAISFTGQLNIPGVTESTSTNTGALTIIGGIGIGKNIYSGGDIISIIADSSTSTIAGNAIQATNGGIGAKTLFVEGKAYANGAELVTTATITTNLSGNIPNSLHITNTTQSTSTNSGALVVDGGVGIAGNVTIGGNLNLLGGGSVLTNLTATTDAYIGASVTKSGTTATINITNKGVQSITAGTDITVTANTGTITINNASTFDTVTGRGASSTHDITLSASSSNTSTIAGNALQVTNGGVGAQTLYLAQSGWINGSQIVTTATVNQFVGTAAITTPLNVTNTASNAFQVAGGAIIGGQMTVQGNLTVNGTVSYLNSNEIDIGNKVIWLSTLTGSAITSAGSGIEIGQPGVATWASWLFDGGSPGNWQSANGIIPTRNDLDLGNAAGYYWNNLYVKNINLDSVVSTSSNYSTSTIAGNVIRLTNGGIGARSIYLTDKSYIGAYEIITSGNLSTYQSVFNGGTITQALYVNSSTNAINTTTGAIHTPGGVGIGQDLYVGGSTYATSLYDNSLRVVTNVSPTAGTGIAITSISTANATVLFTITNIGVTSITTGSGISVSASTGSVTISNTDTLQSVTTRGATTNQAVSITNGTGASSTTSAALIITGGAGVGQNLYVGGLVNTLDLTVTDSASNITQIAGNALTVPNGGMGAQTLYLSSSGYINGAQIVTTATLNTYTGGNINNQLIITNQTQATSTQTGALQTEGGVGIGKNAWIGGDAHILGNLYVDGVQTIVDTTRIQTGDLFLNLATATASAGLATNAGISVGPIASPWADLTFDGASSWKSTGNFVPNGTYSVGASANPWTNLYVTNGFVKSTTVASTTASGALQVVGGIGVGKNIYVGDTAYIGSSASSTLTNTSNSLQTAGGAWVGGQLTVAGASGWINGSPIITATSAYDVALTSLTNSTNSQTGALTVAGGLGVGKDVNISGQIFVNNLSQSTATGNNNALVVSGGLYAGSGMFNTIATVAGAVVITTATIANFAFNGGTLNNSLIVNSSTQATSTITGAFQIVNGGAGIGGNIWSGGSLNVASSATVSTSYVTSSNFNNSTIAGNALQVTGGIGANTLYLANNGYINGNQIITSANLNSFSGGTITATLVLSTLTNAISTQSGALQIAGGVGIGKDVWVGGKERILDATTSTNTTTGALTVVGGVGIGDSVYVGNRVGFGTSTSTSAVYQFYNPVTNSLDTVFG